MIKIISYLTYEICIWGYCAEKFQRKILIPGPCVSFAIACLRNTPNPSSLNRIAFPHLTYFFSEILAIYFMNQLLYRKPSIYSPPIGTYKLENTSDYKSPRPKYKHPSIACIEMN